METGRLPAEAFAGELEVPKQELTRILHRITADDVTYVFDDSISALTQHESGVAVEFYCAVPTSGMGTSQALVGARALARNLASAAGDHTSAFTAYEEELRPYVTRNQDAGRRAAAMFAGQADLTGA